MKFGRHNLRAPTAPAETARLSAGLPGVVAVGLTGSVGAGKSTALRMFADLGAAVFSADEAVHGLYRRPEVRASLQARFGPAVLAEDGAVDRAALAEIVLADEDARRWLEGFIHPQVADEMRRFLSTCPAATVVVFEVPLLFDSGLERMFDLTVTIEAGREVRAGRTTEPQRRRVFEGFDLKQLPSERRTSLAEMAYVNDGDRDHLRRFVETVYRRASDRRASGGTHGTVGGGFALACLALVGVAVVIAVVGALLHDRMPLAMAEQLYPLRYETEIAGAAARYHVDPYVVAAVVKAESGFDPEAKSAAGAVGLMQLMPATADWIVARADWQGASKPDLHDPTQNLDLGTYYLAFLLDRFNDVPTALAAYNAGHGVVEQWLAARGPAPAGGSPTTLLPADIPFPETRGFVKRVERLREIYRQTYPKAFSP
jgi:dephospho-CoA kinase